MHSNIQSALDRLSKRVLVVKESCKSTANPLKRRHEDPDSDPYEGEKKQRLDSASKSSRASDAIEIPTSEPI